MNDEKNIYIVLSHSGTNLSKIVKLCTRKDYSHVSIALDENLEEMYSFGRVWAYNPFYGGLVHEELNKGTLKRFRDTKAAIYIYKVSAEEYARIKYIIYNMYDNRKKYRFNW